MAAVFFGVRSFADGTNGVSGGNQIIVPEDGPLKELAAAVLNTGKKMKLDAAGTLKPDSKLNLWWDSTFPPNAAMQLGLISTNNEPFVVYGLDDLLPDPVYHEPSTITMIRVSKQRGRTDIILGTVSGDMGHVTFYKLYLTSPSGVLEKSFDFFDKTRLYYDTREVKWTQGSFQNEINFWKEKLCDLKK